VLTLVASRLTTTPRKIFRMLISRKLSNCK
jgi:hypothetical protein